jgi:cell division septation protein DedD
VAKLDKHISELLYDHECVIVPELGGFLTSYSGARIHPTQHTIAPPSKKIAFNVFLKHNDGLLANYIVQAESLTYPEALLEIEGYVEICNRELSAGKKFVIEEVGVLTRDAETNLQFEPFKNVNYLKDSFGLSPVHFMPVLNSDFDKEVEKQLRDFISLRPSQPQSRQAIPRRKVRLNSLNTMLLSGSILWLCLNLYIVSPDNINFASLNPFSVSVSNKPAASTAPSKPEVYTQPAVAKPETVYVSSTPPEQAPAKVNATPFSSQGNAAKTKTEAQNYFLVAGAFSSLANAHKMEAELKAQGYSNARVIENKDGLKLVCYDGFDTHEEAFAGLSKMKSLSKDAWIFQR